MTSSVSEESRSAFWVSPGPGLKLIKVRYNKDIWSVIFNWSQKTKDRTQIYDMLGRSRWKSTKTTTRQCLQHALSEMQDSKQEGVVAEQLAHCLNWRKIIQIPFMLSPDVLWQFSSLTSTVHFNTCQIMHRKKLSSACVSTKNFSPKYHRLKQ